MSNHIMRLGAIAFGSLLLAGCNGIYPMVGTLDFHVIGQVTEAETRAPVAGLVVGVLKETTFRDQYLVSTTTDANGNFTLDFSPTRCDQWDLVTSRSDPVRISCDHAFKGVVMNIVIPPGR